MAGIGFELRKIFNNRTIISRLQGYSYAAMVSAGPMIISIFMLVVLGQLLRLAHVSIRERELLTATIMYAFIFSMILVSGLSMITARYIADQIFVHKKSDILASLLGAASLCAGLGGILGLAFFLPSPLPIWQKLLSYELFIELLLLYMLMVYISAVKEYKKISAAFAAGVGLSLALGVLFYSLGLPVVEAVLLAIDIGFMISIFLLVRVIKRYFNQLSNAVFSFVTYVRSMPRLLLTNLFYTLALFSHNFIYWLHPEMSVRLMGTYFFAQTYDIAAFFAVLTILPLTVLFVIRVETSFYEKYAAYIQAVTHGGTLQDIDAAREMMVKVLVREINHIVETQFVISVILALLGSKILLPMLSVDSQTIELFTVLCFGFFLAYMTFIIVTLLLYFDNQKDSCQVMLLLWVSTSLLTALTLLLGEDYYGIGFAVGALLTLLIGIRKLMRTLEQIDYLIFCK